MVVYTASVIISLLLLCSPALGGQQRQLCLKCHPSHYVARGNCVSCHRGNPSAERTNVAHYRMIAGRFAAFTLGDVPVVKEGKRLLDQYACRRCHVSGGRGNRLAASLDGAARKTAGELVLSIRQPVANMPDFALDDNRVTALVNVIFAGAQGHQTDQAAPVRVHFNNTGKSGADIFSTKCGSCHRLLSQRLGAVGTGDIGPNLSGLFSPYYPKTFRNGDSWTAVNLNAWLKNPREIRPWARMLPVTLTGLETKELESIMVVSPK
ncbi:MAG: selenite/tellurite reduction operon c-type cytochrome lipoprotein ExtS [Pelobacteraceae bacterium]